MNKGLQIASYAISFLFVYWVGNALGNFIGFEAMYFHNHDRPVPPIFEFFGQNHHAISYLFLIPWLGFVGFPLLPFVHSSYWDSNMFLLRFSVFVPLEMLVTGFFLLIYHLPNLRSPSDMFNAPPFTWLEYAMRGLFWILALVLLAAFSIRIWRKFKN